MFEVTINGQTYKFDTAEEMAAAYDSKKKIKPRPYKGRKKRKKAPQGLSDKIRPHNKDEHK